MYCSNCGTEIREGVAFCPNCGQPVNNGKSASAQKNSGPDPYQYGGPNSYGNGQNQYGGGQNQYSGQNQYDGGNSYNADPYQYQQQPTRQEPDGFAIASLVLGIVSFFLLPIIGGILAIVFGNKSIRENGMNTMARVGKILGIVALVLYIVIIIIVIASVAMIGVSTLYYF